MTKPIDLSFSFSLVKRALNCPEDEPLEDWAYHVASVLRNARECLPDTVKGQKAKAQIDRILGDAK